VIRQDILRDLDEHGFRVARHPGTICTGTARSHIYALSTSTKPLARQTLRVPGYRELHKSDG
jgi:hypothetical protein